MWLICLTAYQLLIGNLMPKFELFQMFKYNHNYL